MDNTSNFTKLANIKKEFSDILSAYNVPTQSFETYPSKVSTILSTYNDYYVYTSNVSSDLARILNENCFSTEEFDTYPFKFRKSIVENDYTSISYNSSTEGNILSITSFDLIDGNGISVDYDDLNELSDAIKISQPQMIHTYDVDGLHRVAVQNNISTVSFNMQKTASPFSIYPLDIRKAKLSKNIKKLDKFCFAGSTNLSSIENIENVESFDDYALYNVRFQISSYNLPNAKHFGSNVFQWNAVLKTIYASYVKDIGNSCMKDCSLISGYFDSVETIGNYAFAHENDFDTLKKLQYLKIPNVKNIGENILNGTLTRQNIILDFSEKTDMDVPTITQTTFTSSCSANVSVLIPNTDELYNNWKNAQYWNSLPENIKIVKAV